MTPTVSTAYVLAAGLGTRLRPLTSERPKPLCEVLGAPLVHHTLRLLARAGVRTVALNSHWLHPAIPRALGSVFEHEGRRVELRFTHEPFVLGTGGGLLGLRAVAPPPPGERVIVMNADALIDLDVAALLAAGARADRNDALATLVLKEDPEQEKYGVLGTDDTERIVTFAGRVDALGTVARERMFCGVHLVDPRAFDLLPPVSVDADGTATGTPSGINDSAYPEWLRRGERLYAFDHPSTFCDVGTAERLLEANLALLAGTWSSAHLAPLAGFEVRPGGVYVHPRAQLDAQARVMGPLLVDEGAVVEPFADVGPFAVVGKRAVVKRTARVAACVIHADTVVDNACVDAIATPAHRVAVDGRVGQRIRREARGRE